MGNLFSAFDPVSWLSLPLNWVSALTALIALPSCFWLSSNQPSVVVTTAVKMVKNEFTASLNYGAVPGMLLASLGLFTFTILNNSLGLIPYVFTASSHLSFTLALGLPLWIGHMILASMKTPSSVMAHLVPLGTPSPLIPFMVLVEIVSSVIRPMTLAIRLAANMMAGHLLMALLGGQGPLVSWSAFSVLVIGLILLATLECAVSMIQAYVFSVLSTLYINEVNSPNIN